MALDTRLIGQALGEGQPVDLAGAIRPAVVRGEQAVLRTKAQEQRRKELQAQAISQLPQLDESKVPMQMREWAIGQALEARNVALSAIRNEDLGPVEKQMAISNAQQSISKVAAKTNDFKQWIAQFADTQPDDLSKLNSPELMERVNDIYSGKFKVSGDQFVFEDGSTKNFDELVTTRHISRRSDAYRNQLTAVNQTYEKYGLQGWDEKDFDSKITEELSNSKYSDSDIASIVVDELAVDLPEGITIDQIRDDFEDNGRLDDIAPGVKDQLVTLIKNKYKQGAKEAYDRSRKLYNKKIAIKEKPSYTPYQLFQMSRYNAEQNELKNEYLGRTIPAIQKLSNLSSESLNDPTKLQALTGLATQVVGDDYKEYGKSSPGIVLAEKYFIPKNADVDDARRILAAAMVESKMLNQEEVEDVLMAIKPANLPEETKLPTNKELIAKYSN